MAQVWLVPVDEPSYQETLADSVDLTDVPEKPSTFPDEARVWGVRTDPEQGSWERNKRNLEKMERGDPLLFYRNQESRYTGAGRIGPFWRTEFVRDEFWNGGPAIDVYAVEEYSDIVIERETVNRLLEYEETFWPQGLWRVADDRPTTELIEHVEQL